MCTAPNLWFMMGFLMLINFIHFSQLSSINDTDNHLISASICNECVMNVSNFYNFKKKIITAQDFLNSCSANGECIYEQEEENEEAVDISSEECITNDEPTVEDHLEPLSEEDQESNVHTVIHTDNAVNDSLLTELISLPEKRKPNKYPPRGPNKRNKASTTDDSPKVTIQMNECLVCPSILGDIIELNAHILTHENIVCKSCKRTFARYSNLKRHFNSAHSKPKPFQCDICGIGFSFSINLQTHAEIHYQKNVRIK